MPHVEVAKDRVPGGVKLYYELHGSGEEKVIFIMGLTTSLRAWIAQVDYFSKQENIQICVFDNRGIGRSSVPKGRYTTSEMAKDTLELIEHLGWKEFHIVGVSMGGMISQELSLLALNRIKSLCLTCTHAGGFHARPPYGALTLLTVGKIKDPAERAKVIMPLMYSKNFLESEHPSGKKQADVLVEGYVERIRLDGVPHPDGARGQILAVTTHYGIPIMIATGTNDNIVRHQNSFILKEILQPDEFHVYDGVGHGIIYESHHSYNEALLRTIKKGSLRKNA